jgi:hypothetical protein
MRVCGQLLLARGRTLALAAIALALAVEVLAGCGASSQRVPSVSGLPTPVGSTVAVSKTTCDRGQSAFCSVQLVVVNRHYRSSGDLLRAESKLLRRRHWAKADAPEGLELAADSPGDHLRVTYATASQDLQGIDRHWITRVRPVTLSLSHSMLISEVSALSMLLVLGTG